MQSEGVIIPSTLAQEAEVMKVCFSAFGPEDIQRLSVLQVTEHRILNAGQPVIGGPNDPRLGIIRPGQQCQTCLERRNCQGHFGHVKLAEPIFNLGYLPYVEKILRCICHNCTRMKRTNNVEQENKLKRILKIQAPTKRLKALSNLLANISICSVHKDTQHGDKVTGCGLPIPTKITIKEKMKLFVTHKGEREDVLQEYSAFRVRSIFDKINLGTRNALGFTVTKPSDLLISVLAIAPPQIRTSVELGPEKRAEDDITNVYSKIIRLNNEIKQGLDSYKKNINVREIQKLAASIMVKLDKRYLPVLKDKFLSRRKNVRKIKSIEERLTSKEGRFRQNLMGKRVDFSARTVISPDPNLEIDEIGVPIDIAENLTVPEVIHELNYERILTLCQEGKVKFLIQPKSGRLTQNFIYLNDIDQKRITDYLTYGTIAERILQNGDYVLFNRQPTLHRMSMMAHRVRILPYNTFRLNLSVCSPYNADFDGDEMNMHVPQSAQAIAELKHIALVHKQVLSPKNSMPVMGLVQDALLAVYMFTSRDTFLTRKQAEELLFWIDPIKQQLKGQRLPHPCIVKPVQMWSGKQIISCLIPQGLNFDTTPNSEKQAKSYIKNDREGVLIQRGQLHFGSLLKDHLGPGSGLLIHTVWVEMGAEATKNFLGSIQELVSKWLTWQGFSVGINDVMVDTSITGVRSANIATLNEQYYKNLHKFRNLPKYIIENLHQKGKHVEDSLEFKINLDLNNTLSKMQKLVVDTVSPHRNNIYKMIMARSKGSQTNLAQIMFCLGNQNVNGKRCPLGFQSRALPHFSKEDNSPEPRGFVFSSFFGGLKPQEYFFHSMAGREGLSDTAVKTSNIGYLQRKLVKALEDLQISYDGSVRDSQRNLIQQIYGQDGFLSEFVERHTYNDCKLSEKEFAQKYTWKKEQLPDYNEKQEAVLESQKENLLKARISLRKAMADDGSGDIEYHCPINVRRLLVDFTMVRDNKPVIDPVQAVRLVRQLVSCCRFAIFRNQLNPLFADIGVEIFHMHLRLWLCSKMICLYWKMSKEQLESLCLLIGQKFKQAIAPAGEAVGALAAQSIGEPTTQMTLNTFHLAGVSDKNVTLGIPRLRELLDVTKNMKTPYMTVHYMRPLEWTQQNDSRQLAHIQRLMLSILPERRLKDCLQSTHICFDAGDNGNVGRSMIADFKKDSWTPWVLSLKFDPEKIITGHVWKMALQKLRDRYKDELDVRQQVEMSFDRQPEISLRLTAGFLNKIEEKNVYRYLKQKQIEVKEIFLAGQPGIKSVKTSRLTTYNYKDNEGIDLNLESKKDSMVFLAAGSNLKKCLSNPYIDPVKTTTNNLVEVYEVLGIEAARRCFLNEIKEILKPYSIYINHRHLTVLVDWMTCRGTLVPINRHGINRVTDISVLRKASFEQTMDVLYEAAAFSVSDQLKGVSERVIFGQNLNLGTNSCEVHVDLNKVANFEYQQMQKAYLDLNGQRPLDHFAPTPQNSIDERMNGSFASNPQSPAQSPLHGSFSVSPSYNVKNSPAFSDRSASVMSRHFHEDEEDAPVIRGANPMVRLMQETISVSGSQEMMRGFMSSQSPSYRVSEPMRPSESAEDILGLKDEDSESEDGK